MLLCYELLFVDLNLFKYKWIFKNIDILSLIERS